MKLTAASLSCAIITSMSVSPAFADKLRCAPVASAQWMPIEKAIAKSESLGYAVRKAKRSKGCWKVEGVDRQGAEVTVYLNPVSGDLVRSSH